VPDRIIRPSSKPPGNGEGHPFPNDDLTRKEMVEGFMWARQNFMRGMEAYMMPWWKRAWMRLRYGSGWWRR